VCELERELARAMKVLEDDGLAEKIACSSETDCVGNTIREIAINDYRAAVRERIKDKQQKENV
jgi:hypothetical protein